MRTPATVGRFVMAASAAVGIVQVAVLGAMLLITLVGPAVYGKSARLDVLPVWLVVADLVLSIGLVGWTAVPYGRGDLDTFEARRGPRW